MRFLKHIALTFGVLSFAMPVLAVDKWPEGYSFGDYRKLDPNIVETVWVLQSMDGLKQDVFPGTLRIVTRFKKPVQIRKSEPTKIIDSMFIESCGLYRFPSNQSSKSVSRLKYVQQCKGVKKNVADDVWAVRSRFSKIVSEHDPNLLQSLIDWENDTLTIVSAEGQPLALLACEKMR